MNSTSLDEVMDNIYGAGATQLMGGLITILTKLQNMPLLIHYITNHVSLMFMVMLIRMNIKLWLMKMELKNLNKLNVLT